MRGQFVEILIEHHHVLHGRVLGRMASEFHKADFHLQRCVREQTHEVGLRGYLQRHQIEHHDPQRTNFLTVGSRLVHVEDVLMLQNIDCRQSVG